MYKKLVKLYHANIGFRLSIANANNRKVLGQEPNRQICKSKESVAMPDQQQGGAARGTIAKPSDTWSVGSAMMKGTAWTLVMRWAIKAIGMVSVIILARLLTPSDYGLMAMATLVVGLVQVFLDTSADIALLRHPDPSPALIHSAWTMRLLQAVVMAAAVAAAAPIAATYFGEPRLQLLIWALSLNFLLGGGASVGPLLARKSLDFALEARIGVYAKLVSFCATVGCAWWWRNYWAFVAGALAGQIAQCWLGYALHPYRPRFSLSKARDLWGFSKWLLVSGLASFLSQKTDQLVAARMGSARDLGFYRVGSDLGLVVSVELGAPMNRALLPVLSNLQNDLPRLRIALMKTVAVVNSFTLPAGLGLAAVADAAVPIVLGPRWVEATPFLVLFATMGAIRFIVGPYYTMFLTLGHSRISAYINWLSLAVFGLAAWPLSVHFGIIGLAYARLTSSMVVVMAWIAFGHRIGLHVRHLLRAVWRPLIGATLMVGLLQNLEAATPSSPALGLAFKVLAGAAFYAAWLFLSWHFSGRPEGAEEIIQRGARKTLSRISLPKSKTAVRRFK